MTWRDMSRGEASVTSKLGMMILTVIDISRRWTSMGCKCSSWLGCISQVSLSHPTLLSHWKKTHYTFYSSNHSCCCMKPTPHPLPGASCNSIMHLPAETRSNGC
jgi:hypothetical protein